MNQRVKELYEQAQDWADNQNFFASEYYDYMMEKFAELIINECTHLVRDYDSSYVHGPSKVIRAHFGVEEC